MPATTLSSSGAEILTPVAAVTFLTDLNLAFLSRISANGIGSNNALTFVATGSDKEPTTIVSFCCKDPS